MKMKSILAAALLFGTTSAVSYAAQASCVNDVWQMRSQIQKYGSITTQEGRRFDNVQNPTTQEMSTCTAEGYYYGRYVCNIKWNIDNWGNTFHCE